MDNPKIVIEVDKQQPKKPLIRKTSYILLAVLLLSVLAYGGLYYYFIAGLTDQAYKPFAPQPTAAVVPTIPSEGQVCVQVITSAKEDASGDCLDFPTPCDVPIGWTKVASCQPNNSTSFTCPATKSIDCMPIVGADRAKQCDKTYLQWVQKNCPGVTVAM